MASDPKDGTEEIRRLQGSINDLISIQALPVIWDGRESGHIISTLLDVLVSLQRLDFAYARLSDSNNGSPVEFVRLTPRRKPPPQPREVGRALDCWLTNHAANAPLSVPNPMGDGEVRIATFRLGLMDEIGVLVAGSKRADFPTPTETLLLRVAANQALVALQEARQLHEQKRAAGELERRVADRTAQLTAANEALRHSEKKYRTLFDSIDEGFCTVEVLFDENEHPIDYRFLEVNPSFEKQTGIQDAQGRSMREIAPHHEEHWFEIYGRIALTGEPVRFENQAAQLHRWYDVYAFRVGEPGERKVAILFKDITEHKQSEEALRKAQAELAHVSRVTTMGELAASIAHEVNQPLTAVVNNANASLSLLPKDLPKLEEVREALAEIIDDANRASDVIARVRQLAKRAPVEKSLLDLREVVQEVLALARHESAARQVTIRTDLSRHLPSVLGDRVQLQQVLLNLVMNGMDAMNLVEEAKRVLIIGACREIQAGVTRTLVSVQDSGTGVKPGQMDRLFEAFYTTKPQGMGMGLAISRSIIEAHGGRLWAEPNQGPGATFLFSLPVAGDAAS
ncbi:MAG TPA: ATP-binding protein [Candidatus Acidoferrum sp.]|nr:ATP-binding protein [Candidatus Acidoferrum sp.]